MLYGSQYNIFKWFIIYYQVSCITKLNKGFLLRLWLGIREQVSFFSISIAFIGQCFTFTSINATQQSGTMLLVSILILITIKISLVLYCQRLFCKFIENYSLLFIHSDKDTWT